jgi:moderate conductance mechanosensitive channel
MTTKPGERFVILRRALAMIKNEFDAKSIRFAYPTDTVAGGSGAGATPAIGQQALALTHDPEVAGP